MPQSKGCRIYYNSTIINKKQQLQKYVQVYYSFKISVTSFRYQFQLGPMFSLCNTASSTVLFPGQVFTPRLEELGKTDHFVHLLIAIGHVKRLSWGELKLMPSGGWESSYWAQTAAELTSDQCAVRKKEKKKKPEHWWHPVVSAASSSPSPCFPLSYKNMFVSISQRGADRCGCLRLFNGWEQVVGVGQL